MVENPSENRNAMKSSIREMPVTISAFSMGMLVTPIMVVRNFRCMDWIPIAAAVPMTVAIRADRRAMIRVVYRAFIICSFLNSSTYHWMVNPPHLERVLDLLKDSTIKVTMGAYRSTKMSTR